MVPLLPLPSTLPQRNRCLEGTRLVYIRVSRAEEDIVCAKLSSRGGYVKLSYTVTAAGQAIFAVVVTRTVIQSKCMELLV